MAAASSTYDSLYEPIQNPPQVAPSSSPSTAAANYFYDPVKQRWYVNARQKQQKGGSGADSVYQQSTFSSGGSSSDSASGAGGGVLPFGKCSKCREPIVAHSSGCEAMNRLYHKRCFTCARCNCLLEGKPFYAIDGKPICQRDYLDTLEKCCKCLEPIRERILRATGKPYHPQCFTCVMCNKSLDGVPFTVDATNQVK